MSFSFSLLSISLSSPVFSTLAFITSCLYLYSNFNGISPAFYSFRAFLLAGEVYLHFLILQLLLSIVWLSLMNFHFLGLLRICQNQNQNYLATQITMLLQN